MEIKIEFNESDVEDLVCKNIQHVMMGLVGSLYKASPGTSTISPQLPQFRVIERNLDLEGYFGKLDILVADHKNTTFILEICKGEIGVPSLSSAINKCGAMRQHLMTTLVARLRGIQETAQENQSDVSHLMTNFEEDMMDRWQATSVVPVVIGSTISPDAVTFSNSLNSFAVGQSSVSSNSKLIFCGRYRLSISISGGQPPEPQMNFEVDDALANLSNELSLPANKGMEILQAYAEDTCDRLIRDFIDYEQQKKAHKSGMYRVYKEMT